MEVLGLLNQRRKEILSNIYEIQNTVKATEKYTVRLKNNLSGAQTRLKVVNDEIIKLRKGGG